MSPWARMQCTKLTCTDDWLAVAESKIPAVYGRSYVEIPPPRISRLWKTPRSWYLRFHFCKKRQLAVGLCCVIEMFQFVSHFLGGLLMGNDHSIILCLLKLCTNDRGSMRSGNMLAIMT